MKTRAAGMAALVLLAACGRPSGPAAPLPASKIAGPGDPFWKGAFAPVSRSAETGPGDLTFAYDGFGKDGAVQFGRGLVLQTRAVAQPGVAQTYTRSASQTWGDLLSLPAAGEVEVRQVTAQAEPPAGAVGLCGETQTTYLAVGLRPGVDHPGSVALAAFTGAEPPGPRSRDSRLCAVFDYAIPG